MSMLSQYWMYFVPLVIIQLVLQVCATVSLVRASEVRGGSKTVWGVVIWVFQAIGPLVYFAVGRKT